MATRAANDLLFGTAAGGEQIRLAGDLRDRHLYTCGATRTGKSKFLEHLVRQDIRNSHKTGCGLLLLDWHGSLYDNLMKWLARYDVGADLPILPIDMRRDDFVVAYHLLRHRPGAYSSVVTGNLIEDLAYAWGQTGTDQTTRFARMAGNIFEVFYEHDLALADASILLDRNVTSLRRAMTEALTDEDVRHDWEFLNNLKPKEAEVYFESTVNRLRRFVRNPLMRLMFGQTGRSLDFRKAMDQGWIVLVSLAKGEGKVTAKDCQTLATMILADLWQGAQERDKAKAPKPFHLYLDEFQRFITPTLAENMDEAGGFGLHLTMAQQYPSQLLKRGEAGERVYASVMANATTKVVFRTAHQGDLLPLAQELFMGVIDLDEIKHVVESTKVLDYEEDSREVVVTSEGNSEGESAPDMEDVDVLDAVSRLSSGSSRGRTSYEQSFLRPVIGKEVTGVQFRDLNEQFHRAAAKINTLRARHCIARLAETHEPIAFRTADVKENGASAADALRYATRRLKRWKFVLPADEARGNMLKRRAELEGRFLGRDELGDDPTDFRCPVD